MNDAAVDAAVDAAPRDAAAQDPAALLLGSYAVHTRFYGRDLTTGLLRASHQLVVLATIARNAAGALQMRVETCDDSGTMQTEFGGAIEVRVEHLEHYPIRVFDVSYEKGSFFTSGAPLTLGYDAQSPAGCSPNGQLALPNPGKWLDGGMCRCSANDLAPPNSPEDCRVIDSDLDGVPGMTVHSMGIINSDDGVRILDKSRYVNGVVVENKQHRANFVKEEDFFQLKCTRETCYPLAYKPCSIDKQPVSFVPLDGPSSCSEIMKRVQGGALFQGETLEFPGGC